jgi:hypothetical protein
LSTKKYMRPQVYTIVKSSKKYQYQRDSRSIPTHPRLCISSTFSRTSACNTTSLSGHILLTSTVYTDLVLDATRPAKQHITTEQTPPSTKPRSSPSPPSPHPYNQERASAPIRRGIKAVDQGCITRDVSVYRSDVLYQTETNAVPEPGAMGSEQGTPQPQCFSMRWRGCRMWTWKFEIATSGEAEREGGYSVRFGFRFWGISCT